MIRRLSYMASILVVLFILIGCGKIDVNDGNVDSGVNKKLADNEEVTAQTFQAEIIEAGDSLLITPDEESTEYKSSDKIAVNISDAKIINKDGKEITLADLKTGDIIEVTYDGTILESYPAQISASSIKVTDHNIIIDAYLALIDDIYQEDSGLNSDIEIISLDTAGWIEVSEIEKEIIFTKLKDIYGVDIIEGTFDELAEQGIIDKENLYYPNGIHITIANMKYKEKKETITCSLEKWRSGLGAIGSNDVTAKYNAGEWVITKEGMWIS